MVERRVAGRIPSRSGSAGSDPGADFRRPVDNLAQIEVAALLAGAGLLKAWIDVAAAFGDRVRKRAAPVSRGDASNDPQALPSLCQDLLKEFERSIRELTQLPAIFGLQYYAELQRIRETSRTA